MYGEPEAEVLLYRESRIETMRDKAIRELKDKFNEVEAINFAVQVRYHRILQWDPAHDPPKIIQCFNCENPGHMGKDFTSPKNCFPAAARRIELLQKKRTPNAIQMVLATLC